jgi:hypothetical protein
MKNKLALLCVIKILGTSGCASTEEGTKIAKHKKQSTVDCPKRTGSRLKRSC